MGIYKSKLNSYPLFRYYSADYTTTPRTHASVPRKERRVLLRADRRNAVVLRIDDTSKPDVSPGTLWGVLEPGRQVIAVATRSVTEVRQERCVGDGIPVDVDGATVISRARPSLSAGKPTSESVPLVNVSPSRRTMHDVSSLAATVPAVARQWRYRCRSAMPNGTVYRLP